MLSAYGIPMLSDEGGFTSSYVKFDEGGQRTICAFAFPSTWVGTDKGGGLLTASNYQTGDGVILNVDPGKANAIQDLSALAIAAETTPSGGLAKVCLACVCPNDLFAAFERVAPSTEHRSTWFGFRLVVRPRCCRH